MTEYYRKAYEMQRQRRNQELWMQGAYFYEALSDIAPILSPNVKKGTKAKPYIDHPFPLTVKDAKEQKEAEEKQRYKKMRAKMIEWTQRKNAEQELKEDG